MSDSVPTSTQLHPPVGEKSILTPSTNEDIESSNRFSDPVDTIHPTKLAQQLAQQQQQQHQQSHQQQQEEQVSQSDDSSSSSSSSSSSNLSTLRHNDPPSRPPPDFDLEKLLAPHPSQLTVRDAAEFPKAVASTYLPPVGKNMMARGKLAQETRGSAIRHGPPSAHLQQYGGAHGANRMPESRLPESKAQKSRQ